MRRDHLEAIVLLLERQLGREWLVEASSLDRVGLGIDVIRGDRSHGSVRASDGHCSAHQNRKFCSHATEESLSVTHLRYSIHALLCCEQYRFKSGISNTTFEWRVGISRALGRFGRLASLLMPEVEGSIPTSHIGYVL